MSLPIPSGMPSSSQVTSVGSGPALKLTPATPLEPPCTMQTAMSDDSRQPALPELVEASIRLEKDELQSTSRGTSIVSEATCSSGMTPTAPPYPGTSLHHNLSLSRLQLEAT